MKGTKKVFDTTKKEEGLLFLKIPTSLKYYAYHPKVKSEMFYLYGLIANYYNADIGFAYPSMYTLASDYGKTEKTTSDHLRILKSVGLIGIVRTSKGNRYAPFMPYEKEELFRMSSIIKENYEKAQARREQKRQDDLARMRDIFGE